MISTIITPEPLMLNEAAQRGVTVQIRISRQADGSLKREYVTTFHKPKPKPAAPPKPKPPEPKPKPKKKKKPKPPELLRPVKKRREAGSWDDDDPLNHKRGKHSGPEECSQCAGEVYTGGYCFGCGVYLNGGRQNAVGERRDAYEYLSLGYGLRMRDFRHLAFGAEPEENEIQHS